MTSATYEDFQWLMDLIEEGCIKDVEALINSKNFSREIYTLLISPEGGHFGLPSPISSAIEDGQIDIMRMFIDRGLGYQHHDELPLLLDAAGSGHLHIVKALVEDYGHDVNMVHLSGETALTKAVRRRRNIDVVEYLVQEGADVNHVSRDGSILHHCAKSGGNGDICNFLLSHGFDMAKMNDTDSSGKTALHKAAFHHFEDLHILIEKGADVNFRGKHDWTPFFLGVIRSKVNLAILKRLHELGADPDTLSTQGFRPINHAVSGGKLEIVHLLAVTLNVPLRNLDSQHENSNLIKSAVEDDYLSIVTVLLKAGFEIGPFEYKLLSDYVENISCPGSGYIKNVLSNPRSLAHICCFRVRRVLGTSLPQVAENLPLPKEVIELIKLTHVEPEILPRSNRQEELEFNWEDW